MQIGDINVRDEILSLHLQIGIIDKALEYIHKNNRNIEFPPSSEWDKFRADTISQMRQRFPNMDIKGAV